MNFGWLILSAGDDAPVGNLPLRLSASGERDGRAVIKAVQFPEAGWITVLPAAPFFLAVLPQAVTAEQNGGAALDISVTRRPGFDGDVRIAAEELPGVSIPTVTISSAQSRAQLSLSPAYGAEVGIRPVMVRGEAVSGGVTNVTHAPVSVPLTKMALKRRSPR